MAQNSFISSFVRNTTDDDSIESVQNSLENSFRSIEACPLLDGHLLERIDLVNGDNSISHKLGRELKGWIITRHRETASSIIDRQKTNPATDRTLLLNSSVGTTVTVDIWVF